MVQELLGDSKSVCFTGFVGCDAYGVMLEIAASDSGLNDYLYLEQPKGTTGRQIVLTSQLEPIPAKLAVGMGPTSCTNDLLAESQQLALKHQDAVIVHLSCTFCSVTPVSALAMAKQSFEADKLVCGDLIGLEVNSNAAEAMNTSLQYVDVILGSCEHPSLLEMVFILANCAAISNPIVTG